MRSHLFALHTLQLLLVFTVFAYSEIHYYITPSQSDSCIRDSSCLTLSQFAANSSKYDQFNDIVNETEISLILLTGNGSHSLDTELSVVHKVKFSMYAGTNRQGNKSEIIQCVTPSGRFIIKDTVFASIKGLHFVGCGGSCVTRVIQLNISNTIISGVEGSTALILNEVDVTNIANVSFQFNTCGRKCVRQRCFTIPVLELSIALVDCVYRGQSQLMANGGALHVAFSNVSIVNSTFIYNNDETGGVLVANNSSIHIAESHFSNNTATYGGVIVTHQSSVNIDNSIFSGNAAKVIGGMMISYMDSVTICRTNFTNNTGDSGGVMMVYGSLFNIVSSAFRDNKAIEYGGVMCATNSYFSINATTYSNNIASQGGVMLTLGESSYIVITSSMFTNNSAHMIGGVMSTYGKTSYTISIATFTNNSATFGGVMETHDDSSFSITNSTFSENSAKIYGGVIHTHHKSSFFIMSCVLTYNKAGVNGGVVKTSDKSSLIIINSNFTSNRVDAMRYGGGGGHGGGVASIHNINSTFSVTNCTFNNNSADNGAVFVITSDSISNRRVHVVNSTFTNNKANKYGGVIKAQGKPSMVVISGSTFTNNSAVDSGGVIWYLGGSVSIDSSTFNSNVANRHGGVMFMTHCSTLITNSTFDLNLGPIYAFNANLTIAGNTQFHNCYSSKLLGTGKLITHQEGGVITSFLSTVVFLGLSTFLHNQAYHGGAILATQSMITIYGEIRITSNVATNGNGGGIALKHSILEIKGECNIKYNRAVRGGGIYAASSTLSLHQPAVLKVVYNTAENGGGIYFEVSPKLYILKSKVLSDDAYIRFFGNHANYGGAMYIADDTISGACSPDIECFIQTLELYEHNPTNIYFSSLFFTGNTASKYGRNVFGGLLDRCIPSPFAKLYKNRRPCADCDGIEHIRLMSDIVDLDSIASQPVRVCFCSHLDQPECSYQPPPFRVMKGESFTVPLVAVDQVNHTVDADIISSLSSADGGFGEGQQTQLVKSNCTNITFNVFSPHQFEKIELYAVGPCGSATLSTSHVIIQFNDCICPVGFEPLSTSKTATRCECVCDSRLHPFITSCNSTLGTLSRVNTNYWITYTNDTKQPGFVVHPNCPFDYCQSPTKNITINFNLPGGLDTQCAYNRRGVLCGACQTNLSLSLGSSHCLHCDSHWPTSLTLVLTAVIIAGIALVTSLLALNITVASGLINCFIFYANIVTASSTFFFPSSEPSFPSVFIAWLNLDIGFDACFFDGFDTYAKTWFQLAFPVYVIWLVVMIIIISECSLKFTALIGKRDPVATLATLVLLSYAKLLSVTITVLSPAVLSYPDGTHDIVWLADGNVKFLRGKHIPLFLVGLLSILIGLPYTILLFLWQWLISAPNWKLLKWTRNTKLNAFITTYHAPYSDSYRFWTGLQLLIRVVLYITSSLTVSPKPQTSLLVTILLVGGLLLLKGLAGIRVYKNSFADILDTVMYFNLLVLAAFSLYDFKADIAKQTAIAYISTIITFIFLMGMIIYHMKLIVKCRKTKISKLEELNEYLLDPVKTAKPDVTQSVVDISKSANDIEIPTPKVIEAATTAYQ